MAAPGPTSVVTVLGKRGSGKSTLAWKFASLYPRLVVFDVVGEHDESNFDRTVHGFDEFGAAMVENEHSARFRILYRFDVESDSHDDEFNEAMRICYYRGHIAILIEEVWIVSSKGFLPPWLRKCYLLGRHEGLAIIVTSQRPASVHKDIMAQTSHFYSGTMFESNDIKYIAEFLGKENAESLKTIPKFTFLSYVDGEAVERINNRA